MEDMLELAGEVQETLGRAYGLPDDVDEDDLEAGVLRVCEGLEKSVDDGLGWGGGGGVGGGGGGWGGGGGGGGGMEGEKERR